MAQIRVFLDSSVLLAGVVSETGASRLVMDLAETGLIKLVICEQVVVEVDRNLAEKSFEYLLPLSRKLLLKISPEKCPDPTDNQIKAAARHIVPKDAPILAAAQEAQVDCLLTFDRARFTPQVAAQTGLVIQTPGEFIAQLRASDLTD